MISMLELYLFPLIWKHRSHLSNDLVVICYLQHSLRKQVIGQQILNSFQILVYTNHPDYKEGTVRFEASP